MSLFRASSALAFLRQFCELLRSGRSPEVRDVGVRPRLLIAGLTAAGILLLAAAEAFAQPVCPPGTYGFLRTADR